MLILVKHAMPSIDPDLPPAEWVLSEAGRHSCVSLAARLAELLDGGPARLASSREPKAAETARLAASRLNLPVEQVDGLHEHLRPAQALLPRQQFDAAVERLFQCPDEVVFGLESAIQALGRFERAVLGLVHSTGDKNLVIFSHGTVISLFAARQTGLDGFSLWKRLELPSLVVLDSTLRQVQCVWPEEHACS